MKTTFKSNEQRLLGVFTNLKTEEDCDMFRYSLDATKYYLIYNQYGLGFIDKKVPIELYDKIEITPNKFNEILTDKITDWRLVEDGFKELAKGVWSWSYDGHQILITFERELNVTLSYSDQGMIPMCGCETYSDLIKLTELI